MVFVFVCVFIIAFIFHHRNKHVNAVSNIDDQTEEVVTSEDERSNGDTSV